MPVGKEAPYPDPLGKVIESRAPAGAILIANDMVPLLYAPPVAGVGVVVSSGTGSCVLARNDDVLVVTFHHEAKTSVLKIRLEELRAS